MDGWLVIDKPLGITSAQVVGKVKKILYAANKQLGKKIPKVGHAGTLDPLASGILPIAIGNATKLMRFLFDASKEYIFTIKWGEDTDTYDSEGKIIASSEKIPTLNEIESILQLFIGKIKQRPPIYSAIKVQGKRSYDLARKGEEFLLDERNITIESLEIMAHNNNFTQFRVVCGKGTYVRSLGYDIAKSLSTCGHICQLRRTRVGKFALDSAILLENFDSMVYKANPQGLLMPMESGLDDILVLSFSAEEKQSLICGREVFKDTGLNSGILAALYSEGVFFALGEIKGQFIKPIRVFNFS